MNAYNPAVLDVPADQQSAAARIVEYLRGRWHAFMDLDPQIEDLQHRWAVAGAQASQLGDTTTNELAKAAIARLGELRQLHSHAVDVFQALAAQIPPLQGLATGLGQVVPVVPLALIGTVLALGAMVTYIFSRVADEAGKAPGTPGIGTTIHDLGSTLKWVAAAAVAIMLLKTVREATS